MSTVKLPLLSLPEDVLSHVAQEVSQSSQVEMLVGNFPAGQLPTHEPPSNSGVDPPVSHVTHADERGEEHVSQDESQLSQEARPFWTMLYVPVSGHAPMHVPL